MRRGVLAAVVAISLLLASGESVGSQSKCERALLGPFRHCRRHRNPRRRRRQRCFDRVAPQLPDSPCPLPFHAEAAAFRSLLAPNGNGKGNSGSAPGRSGQATPAGKGNSGAAPGLATKATAAGKATAPGKAAAASNASGLGNAIRASKAADCTATLDGAAGTCESACMAVRVQWCRLLSRVGRSDAGMGCSLCLYPTIQARAVSATNARWAHAV